MDWIVGSLGGIWAGLIALAIYIHKERKADRIYNDEKRAEHYAELAAAYDKRADELAAQTKTDHDAVKEQIRELETTVRTSYAPRTEVELAVRAMRESIDGMRQDWRLLATRLDNFADRRAS